MTTLDRIREDLREVGTVSDLTVAEVLGFPESLKLFLRWMIVTGGATREQVAGYLMQTEEESQSLIGELISHGLIEHVPTCGIPVYRVCLTPRRLGVPAGILDDGGK
ncbi:MAG: hypothetical protein ABFD97_13530 [Syntrophobacter sp.]